MEYDSNIRNIIERIMIAYEKTIKGIADLMNASASVIGNRIHRSAFPHDLVLSCIVDTGINPQWLCTGESAPSLTASNRKNQLVLQMKH
jgi:hypothetical protein